MASGIGNHSNSKSLVARGWARISGRRKKNRFPNAAIPEDEPIEVAEIAHEDHVVIDEEPADGGFPQKGRFNRGMDRLRRSLRESFRRKPKSRSTDSAQNEMAIPASTSSTSASTCGEKNPAWHVVEDEVRAGRCQFDVKYLGSVEVFESRGMDVCENAMKVMRLQTQRRRVIKGVLYVSGDGLRVVDSEDNHGLLVDQTIEKVSFCSPDRNHPKGFAYICRDGTTRRWLCHGFHATKESGERLSHAVGCAFAICLEKKRKREAATFDHKETESSPASSGAFSNCRNNKAYSSFNRQLTISERLQDPQSAIVNEPLPSTTASLFDDQILPRPQGNRSLFERQGSFKAPELVSNSSSFRRQYSLRNDYQTKPLYNGMSMIRNEPIIEGEELWPEASVINQFSTLPSSSFHSPVSTSLNEPSKATQDNLFSSSAFQNDGWQGTPVKRSSAITATTANETIQPINWNLQTNSAKGVKADDWLEQMLRNTSVSTSTTVPAAPSGLVALRNSFSGPPPSHPPPPLPPSAEKLAAALGTSPPSIDPFAKGYQRLRNSIEISFSEDLNNSTKADKIRDSTNSIAYSLLNESANNSATSTTIDLTGGCNSNEATDLFGQPVFNPTPTPTPVAPTTSNSSMQLCNGMVCPLNSTSVTTASSDDPFDVKWSALAMSSAAAKSTNPFATNTLAAR